jgi:protein disulfide-isomerase
MSGGVRLDRHATPQSPPARRALRLHYLPECAARTGAVAAVLRKGMVPMRALFSLLMLLCATVVWAEDAYDEIADAHVQLSQTQAQAKAEGKMVLLIFGANWCEDCRALNQALKAPETSKLMASRFKVLKINIGEWDKNLDLDAIYGHPTKTGIPAAVLLSPDQQIVYVTKAGELADARKMSEQGIYDFFLHLASQYQ